MLRGEFQEQKRAARKRVAIQEKIQQLETLWDVIDVPTAERNLFALTYFDDEDPASAEAISDMTDWLSEVDEARLYALKKINQRERALASLLNIEVLFDDVERPPVTFIKAESRRLTDGLRDATLEAVEAIVHWRQHLSRPFPFLWNGFNYMAKLSTDLHGLIHMRMGSYIPTFVVENPLLLLPETRYAAEAGGARARRPASRTSDASPYAQTLQRRPVPAAAAAALGRAAADSATQATEAAAQRLVAAERIVKGERRIMATLRAERTALLERGQFLLMVSAPDDAMANITDATWGRYGAGGESELDAFFEKDWEGDYAVFAGSSNNNSGSAALERSTGSSRQPTALAQQRSWADADGDGSRGEMASVSARSDRSGRSTGSGRGSRNALPVAPSTRSASQSEVGPCDSGSDSADAVVISVAERAPTYERAAASSSATPATPVTPASPVAPPQPSEAERAAAAAAAEAAAAAAAELAAAEANLAAADRRLAEVKSAEAALAAAQTASLARQADYMERRRAQREAAAVTLQCFARRAAARRKVAALRAKRDREADAVKAKAAAAVAAQRRADEQNVDAIKIQAAYRGHRARKQVALMRKKEATHRTRVEAATKIQAVYRGHLERRRFAAKLNLVHTKEAQRQQRVASAKKSESGQRQRAAMRIQRAWRRYKRSKILKAEEMEERRNKKGSAALRVLQQMKREDKAATRIQAVYRGFRTRRMILARRTVFKQRSAAGMVYDRPILVRVVQAKNLPLRERSGHLAAYVDVRSGRDSQRTKTIANTANPTWNQSLLLKVPFPRVPRAGPSPELEFAVYDRKVVEVEGGAKKTKRRHLGSATVRLDDFSADEPLNVWVAIDAPPAETAKPPQDLDITLFHDLSAAPVDLNPDGTKATSILGTVRLVVDRILLNCPIDAWLHLDGTASGELRLSLESEEATVRDGIRIPAQLVVTAVEARGLTPVAGARTAVYCVAKLGANEVRSRTAAAGIEPAWGSRFSFDVGADAVAKPMLQLEIAAPDKKGKNVEALAFATDSKSLNSSSPAPTGSTPSRRQHADKGGKGLNTTAATLSSSAGAGGGRGVASATDEADSSMASSPDKKGRRVKTRRRVQRQVEPGREVPKGRELASGSGTGGRSAASPSTAAAAGASASSGVPKIRPVTSQNANSRAETPDAAKAKAKPSPLAAASSPSPAKAGAAPVSGSKAGPKGVQAAQATASASKIGAVPMAEAGVRTDVGAFAVTSADAGTMAEGHHVIFLTITNTSLQSASLRRVVLVLAALDEKGQPVATTKPVRVENFSKRVLAPGDKRLLKLEWPEKLPVGKFRASLDSLR